MFNSFSPYDKELDYNYLTLENNARLLAFSSQTKGCPASNVLSTDRKAIWLSETYIPQQLIIDIGNLTKKTKTYFKYFGVYCWHAYSTNPKLIELQFSKDNKNFLSFGKYDLALKPGSQFFEIKNNKLLEFQKYRFLKVIIKETWGGNRTYLNQIYLFDDLSGFANASTSESIKVTETKKRKFSESLNEESKTFQEEECQQELYTEENYEEEPMTEQKPSEFHHVNKNEINYTHFDDKHTQNKSDFGKNYKSEADKVKQILKSNANVDKLSKKKLNKSYTFVEENNEYRHLEHQLRDMEDYLKSLEADVKLEESKVGSLRQSKSFSFLHQNRDTNDIFNYRMTNPFDNSNYKINKTNDNYSQRYNFNNFNNEVLPNLNINTPKSETLNRNHSDNLGNLGNLEHLEHLEEKINKFETELGDLKSSVSKLVETVNKLVNSNIESQKSVNYSEYNNEMANFILGECNRMINERFNNLKYQNENKYSNEVNYNQNKKYTDTNSEKSKQSKYKDDVDNFEEKLNRKIESKFESLATNIESQIYNNFLKPSICTIEKTMQSNFEDIKHKIKTLNTQNSLNNSLQNTLNNFDSNRMPSPNESVEYQYENPSVRKLKETERVKNLDNKLIEINALGGKLYDKLIEKEKKLNQLKQETTKNLKQRRNHLTSSQASQASQASQMSRDSNSMY